MYHFKDVDVLGQHAAQLNEFLGAPFETQLEAADLIRRMPDWRQYEDSTGALTTMFQSTRTGARVVIDRT